MKNIIFIYILILIGFVMISLSSCVRYKTVTKHTRDTSYVDRVDTQRVYLKDTTAPAKAKETIKEVFVEIEKDCPNIKDKLPGLQKKIEDVATIESLTGGYIKVYSPQLKDSVSLEFIGNEGTAYFKGKDTVIEDRMETTETKEESALRKALDLWQWFVFGFLGTALTFFIIGRFVRFFG